MAGVDADGVVAVVDAAMGGRCGAVTVERGVDPRGLALVAFGGAGPLHACALADALGMAAVVVPPRAGRAVGRRAACCARPAGAGAVVAQRRPTTAVSRRAPGAIWAPRSGQAGPVRRSTTAVDCRYAGQSHELHRAAVDAFPTEHERRNGYVRPGAAVEVVALRARASVAVAGRRGRPARVDRQARRRAGRAGRARLHDLGARRAGGPNPGAAGALVLAPAT